MLAILFALALVATPPKGQVDFVDASGAVSTFGPCWRTSARYDTGTRVVHLRVDCSIVFNSGFED